MSRRTGPNPEGKGKQRQKQDQQVPSFVVDASALLAAFLPEENWEAEADAFLGAYQEGRFRLVAPTLLPYEILNSVYLAVRGKAGRPPRITQGEAQQTWAFFQGLGILLQDVDQVASDTLELAFQQRWRSIYDLAYVSCARQLGTKLISADPGLVEAFGDWVHPLWKPLSQANKGDRRGE